MNCFFEAKVQFNVFQIIYILAYLKHYIYVFTCSSILVLLSGNLQTYIMQQNNANENTWKIISKCLLKFIFLLQMQPPPQHLEISWRGSTVIQKRHWLPVWKAMEIFHTVVSQCHKRRCVAMPLTIKIQFRLWNDAFLSGHQKESEPQKEWKLLLKVHRNQIRIIEMLWWLLWCCDRHTQFPTQMMLFYWCHVSFMVFSISKKSAVT